MRWILTALILAGLFVVSDPAMAQGEEARKDGILQARMATSRGDFTGCVRALEKIPGTPEHRLLAFCYESLGDGPKAIHHYRAWLKTNGSSMRAPSVRARLEALEREPIVALEREARDAMLAGDLKGCVEKMDAAIKAGSKAFYQLGICHEKAGEKDKAIAAYQQWLAATPDGEVADQVRKKLDRLQMQ